MKTFILTILISTISLNFSNENIKISDDLVKVTFDRKTSFNQLVKIKLDLAEKGITINYKKIVYTKYDELTEISFEVNCNDGFKGTASSSNLLNNEQFGFIRDYKGKNPFTTGDLSKSK